MIEVNKPMNETEAGTPGSGSAADVPAHDLPPFELQAVAAHAGAAQYQLAELVRYHDRAFVAHAYAALCHRAPTDAELAHTLDNLRTGRRSKVEIIESLCAGTTAVQVVGLPSPMLRRVTRWPVVGYVLRLLRGLTRLPVLMQHQQQFEIYALAQQQRLADYLNEVLAPAVAQGNRDVPDSSALAADAVQGVLMLSDSLIELSARHAEVQAELERFQAQQRQVQAELAQFQAQQRQVQAQLQTDLLGLGGQREFLMQEQRVIVETQRVVLGEFQEQLRELSAQQEQLRVQLAAQVRQLPALVAAATDPPMPARTDEHAAQPERDQP